MTAVTATMTPGAVAQLSNPMAKLIARIDYGETMRRRAVQDAILNASAWQWRRRADLFDWARPKPGDYLGGPVDWETGAPAEFLEFPTDADRRCAAAALACREHAAALEAGWFE